MHYIVGTEVAATFNDDNTKKIQSVNFPRVVRKQKNTTPFQLGSVYTLHNIKKVKDGFEYRFVSGGEEDVALLFPSVTDADLYISQLRNEPLPNYAQFNLRRRD